MNEPQHIEPERIEGEFHYARKVQGDVVFESWMIFRRGDDEEASDYYWRGRDARRIVEALDAAARHFTATAVKEERERVLAEHAHSVQFAVETCEAIAGDSRIERVAPHLWADASRAEQRLRPLLAAAAPQENNQEGEG